MRYLFVHQNFPGQFVHLLRHLIAQKRHDIVFISEDNPNRMDGVRRLIYGKPPDLGKSTFPTAAEFELATLRAHAVTLVARQVDRLGFKPDIVIGHHGWGELLDIRDVWPGVPLLGYQEFFYRLEGLDVGFDPEFPTPVESLPRIRAKNAVNFLTLTNGGRGQTPTAFQRDSYPDWARSSISILPEGVDLEGCRPSPEIKRRTFKLGDVGIPPRTRLVTYVSRDLEPYRGFHTMMRSLPRLFAGRADVHVIMVGGDGVSYGAKLAEGSWRERMLAEVGDRIDRERLHFVGKLDYADYKRLLKRSDAHVYLTYPFVLSWSLREALACGCAVVASDTAPVREFITHGGNGLLTPFLEPDRLAETILEVLENRALAGRLSSEARAYAERTLRMDTYLDGYDQLIDDVINAPV